MDLSSIKHIAEAISWFLTLGKSDLRQVRTETEELLNDLRKSLVNLWDVTTEVTRLAPDEVTVKSFSPIRDYVYRFYLNPHDISAARTHCGNVERDVERITFKLSTLLHSDLGKWKHARTALRNIIDFDGTLTTSYDKCIKTIWVNVEAILDDLKSRRTKAGREKYKQLRRDLESDVAELKKYMTEMEDAARHLWKVAG